MTKPQLQPGASGHNDACPCGSQKKYEKCCGKAARLSVALQAALQACEAKNWQQAQTSCEQALRVEPNHADALQLRVTIALQRRDHKTALTYLRRAIQQSPQSSTLYNILGTIQLELQRINEAEQSYKTAIQLDSDNAKAHHKLGDIWHSQGKLAEAQQAYREALRCQPNFPEVHNNLGQLLLNVHQYDQAIVHLVRAIELRPEQHKTYHLLALALQEQGRYQQAQSVLEQVIRLKPDYAEAWHELGVSLLGQRRLSEGIAALEKSVQLDPKLVQGYLNLGGLHYEHGLADIAREYFRRAQAIRPNDALHIKTALCLPAVYESAAQVQAERECLTAELKHLANKKLRLTDPLNEVALTPFYLAYQGENEVEMLSRIGDLFLKACPTLGQVAPHCLTPKRGGEPLKIGFLSSSFARENHIVNRVMSGVIANWPRDHFRVTLLHPNAPCNEIRLMLRDGDRLLHVPNALEAARQQIAAAQFDILFYCDLGMEPWTYFLAFSRLARIQLTSGGHPLTSGIPTVDYFVSSALDEVPHAQQHYRERLIALPQRPVCYTPAPPSAQRKTRSDFGLSDSTHLYFCPMTPYKLHPDDDALFGEILRTDPAGEILFVINSQVELWERLKQRFARTLPDVYSRLRFLPFLPMSDFVELLRLSDVLLDTTKFNGGTTSLEALAVGTPIVTWPGELLRQRSTYAMYNTMQMFDCVAQDRADYVRLATEIACCPEYREQLRQEILARNAVLYGQTDWIKPLSDFLLEAVESSSL